MAQFLLKLYKKGLGYSAVNTARSTLLTILPLKGVEFCKHPIATRMVKRIFRGRPAYHVRGHPLSTYAKLSENF